MVEGEEYPVNTETNRRTFLKTSAVAAATGLSGLEGLARSTEKRNKPNVLFLISDDHAAYVCGAYGNQKARTPNLDGFAETGVRFTNAYCNSPMCTPSRQSFITGKVPHSVGVTMLRSALPEQALTIGELLKEHGYSTAAIGKMHFNSNLKHGFDHRLDHREHRQYLQENPPRPVPDDVPVLPRWRPFRDPASVWLNGMYYPYGAYDEDMAGTWFAREAQKFLRDHVDEPFFLVASFYEPHSPFRFPIEYSGMFDPDSFDPPEPGPEDAWQMPEIFRDLTRSEKQGITASYYTSTAFMDKNVGLVLDTLKETGLDENTLVIYLGDHGYNLGHHGRFEKHCSYDEAVRAPLMIRLPGSNRRNVASDALVEFIDVFPTIADVCGIEIPEDVEGRSLLPVVEGKTDEHREYAFSEYYPNEEAMVCSKRFKYVFMRGKRIRPDGYKTGLSPRGRTERLFDLVNDPNEMNNLAYEAEYEDVVNRLKQELLRRLEHNSPYRETLPPGLSIEEKLEHYLNTRGKKF